MLGAFVVSLYLGYFSNEKGGLKDFFRNSTFVFTALMFIKAAGVGVGAMFVIAAIMFVAALLSTFVINNKKLI